MPICSLESLNTLYIICNLRIFCAKFVILYCILWFHFVDFIFGERRTGGVGGTFLSDCLK